MNPKKPAPAVDNTRLALIALQAYHYAANANNSLANVDDAFRLSGRQRIRVLAEVYLRCASEAAVVIALGGTDGGLVRHLFCEIQSRCTSEDFLDFKAACESCGYHGAPVDGEAFANGPAV